MGLALAQRASARGAKVTLIHGPVSSPIPGGLHETIAVKSTNDLLNACETALKAGTDGFIMAAAPADFRPAVTSTHKTKKNRRGQKHARSRVKSRYFEDFASSSAEKFSQ